MYSEARPVNLGDRLIRIAAAATVTAVAAIAAVISYTHIADLAASHGQSGLAATLLPVSVDGLILAASLVMLQEARAARATPALARWMLGLGVAATLAANIAYGARYGVPGAIISAWPAVAFIGGAELLMGMIRRARPDTSLPDVPALPGTPDSDLSAISAPEAVNGQAYPEALYVFREDLAVGKVPTIARIRADMACGQPKAQRIRAYLAERVAG